MAINITNSIGQHKIPQRITQKQNTLTFLATGSCMAHLNCCPRRAAGVNFWFFIAVPFGGGCWYKAKCEMLLRKIDSEKNVHFPRNGDGVDMLHDQRQLQLSRTRTAIFRRYDTSPTSKSRRR